MRRCHLKMFLPKALAAVLLRGAKSFGQYFGKGHYQEGQSREPQLLISHVIEVFRSIQGMSNFFLGGFD